MKTVGQLLQEARLKKKLELADVARITRIRSNFLRTIENDDYGQLPSGTVARGFIHNYCELLGLSSEHVLAIFRRDFVENDQGQIVPRGMTNPINKSTTWTPQMTIVVLVTIIFTVFGAYLLYQYRLLVGPPFLEIMFPKDWQIVSQRSVEVQGKTNPEATIAVNGQLLILDKGGFFSLRLPLTSGNNLITIVATSKSGKTTTKVRNIISKP